MLSSFRSLAMLAAMRRASSRLLLPLDVSSGGFAEEIFVGLVEFGGAVVHEITPLRLLMLQQFRQLCNVRRDAAGLVAGEQVRSRAPARLVLEIDVGERLPVRAADKLSRRRSLRRTKSGS